MTTTLAKRAWIRARRFTAPWSGAVLVLVGLRGADPVDAQPRSQGAGCPSFHEVHPAITAQEALRSGAPPGFKIYPGIGGQGEKQLLREIPIVSGAEIADAWDDLHFYTNQPVVRFLFNDAATRRFGNFTTRSIGRSFAIVLDGPAISLLRIMEPILRGVGEIDGGFTAAEAKQLAARIKSGACRSQQ
jgi:SecD/SecF fusion protein